jgi:hypothetical protein
MFRRESVEVARDPVTGTQVVDDEVTTALADEAPRGYRGETQRGQVSPDAGDADVVRPPVARPG